MRKRPWISTLDGCRILRAILILLTLVKITGYSQPVQRPKVGGDVQPSILQTYGDLLTPSREIASLRSLNTLHYRIDNRRNIAVIGSRPLSYVGPGGVLEPISNVIIPDAKRVGEGYSLRNEANDVLFYFSDDGAHCSALGPDGREIVIITSRDAEAAGTISVSKNQITKTLEGDSSEFSWTVNGSALSYRWSVNRKAEIESLERLVRVDWTDPVVSGERFEETWSQGHVRGVTVSREGGPGGQWQVESWVTQSETSTTLTGSISIRTTASGTLLNYGNTINPYVSNSMRLQNLSDPGCASGYRAWGVYDLSGLHPGDTIITVEQMVHVADIMYYWYDPVDLDIMLLDVDPQSASAQSTWNATDYGARYVSDLGFVATGWHTIPMPAAALDLSLYLTTPGVLRLGYMVWCREDNSDFYILISGSSTANAPSLVVEYSPVTDVAGIEVPPERYELLQNYPNPFNPTTTIGFSIPHAGLVSIEVFNTLGQVVGRLVNEELRSGHYKTTWDGSGLSSGIYYYRLQAASFSETRKLLLLR